MKINDLLLFQEGQWIKDHIISAISESKDRKDFKNLPPRFLITEQLTKNQEELKAELKQQNIIKLVKISQTPDEYLVYEVNKKKFDDYCKEEVDSLSKCKKGNNIQISYLLNKLYRDYTKNKNTIPEINEEVLGTYKANPYLANESEKNPIHNLKFNRTIQLLEDGGFLKVRKFIFDPIASPKPISQETEKKLKEENNHITQIDYHSAGNSQYKVKYTDKFLNFVKRFRSKTRKRSSEITKIFRYKSLILDLTRCSLCYGTKCISISPNNQEIKLLRILLENKDSLVEYTTIARCCFSSSDNLKDSVVRRQIGFIKRNLINKLKQIGMSDAMKENLIETKSRSGIKLNSRFLS